MSTFVMHLLVNTRPQFTQAFVWYKDRHRYNVARLNEEHKKLISSSNLLDGFKKVVVVVVGHRLFTLTSIGSTIAAESVVLAKRRGNSLCAGVYILR